MLETLIIFYLMSEALLICYFVLETSFTRNIRLRRHYYFLLHARKFATESRGVRKCHKHCGKAAKVPTQVLDQCQNEVENEDEVDQDQDQAQD